jgi:uncharacterized RDD family membrane protein YckC
VNPERLVNGEGVEVDLRYARLGSRGLALLIDILSQIALFIGLFVIIGPLTTLLPEGEADDAFFAAATVAVIVVVLVVYPTTIETLTNGRSLGKLAVGLRVVRADGGPIRLRHALTRALVGVTLEWPGLMLPFVTWVVSMTTMLFSRQGRRLGDLAAGTFVVHERTATSWAALPPMPPPLIGWAQSLDLSALDDDLALAARHALGRAPQLTEPYGRRLQQALSDEIVARVGQLPPPGTPPRFVLAAVLAERRRRAGELVFPARALVDRVWPGFGRHQLSTSDRAF